MIYTVSKDEYNKILNYVDQDKLQNPYFYIDINCFGFSSGNTETYICLQDNEIRTLIYRYYNTLQLFQVSPLVDVSEVCEFITTGAFVMISGISPIISALKKSLSNYRQVPGVLMKLSHDSCFVTNDSVLADKSDYFRISELICEDEGIGRHYTTRQLAMQLQERSEKFGCRSMVIKKNDEIVSHMSTYAELDDMAVLGGLITARKYRGQGLGRQVLCDLASMIKREGKIPLLYCYEQNTVEWYQKIGWQIERECAKLEIVADPVA